MANKVLRALLGGLAGGAQGVAGEFLRQQELDERNKVRAVEALRQQRADERTARLDARQGEMDQFARDRFTFDNIMGRDPEQELTSDESDVFSRLKVGTRRGSKQVEDASITPNLPGQSAPDVSNFMRSLSGAGKSPLVIPYETVGQRSAETNLRPLSGQEALQKAASDAYARAADDPRYPPHMQMFFRELAMQGGRGGVSRPTVNEGNITWDPNNPDKAVQNLYASNMPGQVVATTPAEPTAQMIAQRGVIEGQDRAGLAAALGLDAAAGINTWEDLSKRPDLVNKYEDWKKSKRGTPVQAGGDSADTQATDGEIAQLMALAPEVRMSVLGSYTKAKMDKLLPKLIESGLDNFGRPMSENAVGRFAELDSSVGGLNELKAAIQTGEKKFGPIQGFATKWNPYDAEGQSIIAKIDLVRQRVGKALEGGVLRKEDEEKYKRILATVNDLPAVTYSKIDDLIKTLERDRATFANYMRLSGRFVSPAVGGGGAQPTVDTSGFERVVGPDGVVTWKKKGGG